MWRPSENKKLDVVLLKYGLNPTISAGCGAGWVPEIEDLIQKLIKVGWNKDLHQIKEKFGSLRFYIGEATPGMVSLIRSYESQTFQICENCGKPGKSKNPKGSHSWIKTLCENCDDVDNY